MHIIKYTAKKIPSVVWVILPLILTAGYFCYPVASLEGMKNGLLLCANVIVPSLFPFMVLSLFINATKARALVSKPLGWVCKHIFHLPPNCGAAVLLSFIGGYPVGAKMTVQLLENKLVTKEQAERMLSFCVNAGPAFLITAVGAKLFQNTRVGLTIFLCNTLAALLTGAFFLRKQTALPSFEKGVNYEPPQTALVNAVNTTTTTILQLCGFILFFCWLCGVLTASGWIPKLCAAFFSSAQDAQFAQNVFYSLLEVTNGCNLLSQCSKSLVIPAICFVTSLSGCSIALQVKAIVHTQGVSLKYFYVSRLINAVFSFSFGLLAQKIFTGAISCSSVPAAALSQTAGNPFASLLLVLFCLLFLTDTRIARQK